jgi:hypothetical protein
LLPFDNTTAGASDGPSVLPGNLAASAEASLGRERADEDEGGDIGVADRRVADDHAAIGVTDQDDTIRNAGDDVGDVRSVAGHTAQRIGDADDGVAVVAQDAHDTVPTGRIGECAVHEYDGRPVFPGEGIDGDRHRGGEDKQGGAKIHGVRLPVYSIG